MRTRKVTIKDIATEAGVSIALVSFVMNNKADGKETYRVNKETAQRILEVAEKLNYQPNNAARTLRSGKTNTKRIWPFSASILTLERMGSAVLEDTTLATCLSPSRNTCLEMVNFMCLCFYLPRIFS